MKITIVGFKDETWGELPAHVSFISPYNQGILFVRFIRKLFYRCTFIQNIINKKSLKNMDADTIIVFDYFVTNAFLRWLVKNNKGKRIILWYWNPAHLTISPYDVPSEIEKWSYSKTDCEKYGMIYNTQFCFDIYPKEKVTEDIDVLFVGRDKGRAESILKIEELLQEKGLKTDFRIIKSKKDFMSYKDILDLVNRSKCILDFCINETAGMSLRSLEALFMDKKVITNNMMYLQEKFYNEKNVFVFGNRDINSIESFLCDGIDEIEEGIKQEYLFENWISRF